MESLCKIQFSDHKKTVFVPINFQKTLPKKQFFPLFYFLYFSGFYEIVVIFAQNTLIRFAPN